DQVKAAIPVLDEDQTRVVVDKLAQKLLLFALAVFARLAAGDVARDANQTSHMTGGIVQGNFRGQHPLHPVRQEVEAQFFEVDKRLTAQNHLPLVTVKLR